MIMAVQHISLSVGNSKTGGIPTSGSSRETCPDTCAFKDKGCYAKYGKTGMQWKRLNDGVRKDASNFDQFLTKIKAIKEGALWRHNVYGDLAGENTVIDKKALLSLVEANKGKRGYTYTHKPMTAANKKLVKFANDNGFTINLSANTLAEADKYMALGVAPVACVIDIESEKVSYTPKGHKVVVCPAQTTDATCQTCKLCAIADRNYIIGFLPHGSAKKTVNLIAKDEVKADDIIAKCA